MNKLIEKQPLQEAIKVLTTLTGSKVKVLSREENQIDARIAIRFAGVEYNFNVEIKGEIRQSQVLRIIERFGRNKDQWLLIARYIPQPMKEYLKSLGINYLELSGNCYINVKGIFIYIADQKVTPIREITTGKLWKPTGLKFMMAVINDPDLLTASYREIAAAAGIALGNIGPLLKELKESGYTLNSENTEPIANRNRLISRWTEIFHATLKPGLLKGRFRFIRPEAAKEWKNVKHPEVYWGGEPGAALITGHLTPEHFTIYSEKSGNELLKILGIVPDDNGNITIFEKFWGEIPIDKRYHGKPTPAPLLLIYADLANELDSRNKEVAERIKVYLNGK